MVFTKVLLENVLAVRPCKWEAASEPLLPKVARCILVLPSRYIGKCAARVLKRSGKALEQWSQAEEGSCPGRDTYQTFFSAMIFILVLLGLMDFSDIVMLRGSPNICCQQNLKCFDMPLLLSGLFS